MTRLAETERAAIKNTWIQEITPHKYSPLRAFASQPIYLDRSEKRYARVFTQEVMQSAEVPDEERLKIDNQPLTYQEKLALAKNNSACPVKIFDEPLQWGVRHKFEGYGMRNFFGRGNYGFTPELVRENFEKIRAENGSRQLTVLDVGGADGRAMAELKQFDPEITTINLTSTETAEGMKPVDKLLVLPVEHLPSSLKGKIDFIVSNMAWQYFTYPDIALRNVVGALAKNGEAHITVGSSRSPIPQDEQRARLLSAIGWLRHLESQGKITTNGLSNISQETVGKIVDKMLAVQMPVRVKMLVSPDDIDTNERRDQDLIVKEPEGN